MVAKSGVSLVSEELQWFDHGFTVCFHSGWFCTGSQWSVDLVFCIAVSRAMRSMAFWMGWLFLGRRALLALKRQRLDILLLWWWSKSFEATGKGRRPVERIGKRIHDYGKREQNQRETLSKGRKTLKKKPGEKNNNWKKTSQQNDKQQRNRNKINLKKRQLLRSKEASQVPSAETTEEHLDQLLSFGLPELVFTFLDQTDILPEEPAKPAKRPVFCGMNGKGW